MAVLSWQSSVDWILNSEIKDKMGFRKLIAYKKGFELAMEIFEITKTFPKDETYSLTNQIRRLSHSVCANIAKVYRKRTYPKHFYNKLTDSDAENSETLNWSEFAFACKYITQDVKNKLESKNVENRKVN